MSDAIAVALIVALAPLLLAVVNHLLLLRVQREQAKLHHRVNGRLDELIQAKTGEAKAQATLDSIRLPPPSPPTP